MLSFARRTVVETLENSDKDVCDRDDGAVRFIQPQLIAVILFFFLFHLYLCAGNHEKVSQHLTEAVIDDSDGFANDICWC